MRTALSPTTLLRPRSIRDALAMLRDEGPLTPIAGCTDVYVGLNFGTLAARRFLDLWPLRPLRGIERRGDVLRLGALTTYADIIGSAEVRRRLPMLVACAREVGGRQIQNRGTIGGNIVNASPAGDTLPVLAAVDATVVLKSAAAGERRVAFNAFYTGYRASVMRADELVVAIEVPVVRGRQWWRKVGPRKAQAISKVMLAGVRPPASGRGSDGAVRLALGSVAPTVKRLARVEAMLTEGGSVDEACRLLGDEIAPIDDVRSTAAYRRAVSENLIRLFWRETGRTA